MRKVMYCIIIVLLIYSTGCNRIRNNKNEEIEVVTTSAENTESKLVPNIADYVIENIEMLFQVDVPDEGRLIYYEASLEPEQLGYIYAEIKYEEKYYQEFIEQLGVESTSPSRMSGYNEKGRFQTKAEEVDKVYLKTGDLRRKLDAHYVGPLPMSFMYSIYVTQIEDGIFKVMFEANPC